MNVQIVNHSKHELPAYSTELSAGMDIRANLDAPVKLKPLERKLIPTGLFIQLPKGFEAQIRPRSGMALKRGITVLNTPGTIDADYRGEIMIAVINHGKKNYAFRRGDRIAQMLVKKVYQAKIEIAEQLDETARGKGGFGHTGL